MPLEKFFVLPSVDFKRENILKPGEIVTEIFVPYPKSGSKGYYHKCVSGWPGSRHRERCYCCTEQWRSREGTHVWFLAAWHLFRGGRRKLNSFCVARRSMKRLLKRPGILRSKAPNR